MTTPVSPKAPVQRRQRTSRRPVEDTRAARAGAWLFRRRGLIPIPFVLVPLVAQTPGRPFHWILGLALVVAGVAVRMAAAGAAFRGSSRDVDRLVTYGIFAWTRNPLYLGDLLAWLGFAVVSGATWFVPVAIALFAVQFSLIVRYEEAVLAATFGDRYDSYRHRTPRWLPRRPRARLAGDHDWSAAARSELTTFAAYFAILITFAVKRLYS